MVVDSGDRDRWDLSISHCARGADAINAALRAVA